ncbi:zinc finger protein 414 [Betta splendens]|uniref:Zinc finger protein 414 n=1 Tax=Betta splendens TaxID=158456 RepID=A0A6P7M363_BETSP|nr:zinc finger protein 414 [Betta splendens]
MATGSAVIYENENGNGGNKTQCPLHGCKRVYTDTSALESHIKDHEIPAQSIPGKVMLCSTVGCRGSFPNIQKLMEHMRHHHKPNIYFLCESCRTKLRSYRGLLTHLHTCSKVSRGKPKSTEPTHTQPASVPNPNLTPTAMGQDSSRLDAQSSSQIANADGSNSAVFHPGSALPSISTPLLSHADTAAPQQLSVPQPSLKNGVSTVPPSLSLAAPTSTSDVTDSYNQHPEPVHPSPVSAPLSPSGSSAVWKRNQGMTHSRRILWEHTKGRYTCVQCGQTATNRKEMTQHISQHSGNKAAEDTNN